MAKELLSKPVIETQTLVLKERCEKLKSRGVFPLLKVVLVGNNLSSATYVRNKKKFIEKLGASCEIIALDEKIDTQTFQTIVRDIGIDPKVHGCFVQFPLPKHLSALDLNEYIPSEKDVDGLTKDNLISILEGDRGDKCLPPCTPKGILTLLKAYDIALSGKHVVIVGRSLIVGKPLALLMLNENATVTICHSKTENLEEITKQADILVSAIGKKDFIRAKHVRKGQVVIDVGTNYDENNKLCGDVKYEEVAPLVDAITPVPGGVGPMTIFTLAQNLLQAAEKVV